MTPKLGFELLKTCPFHSTLAKYPLPPTAVGSSVGVGVGVGVTTQEHADETLDESPAHCETNVGRGDVAATVTGIEAAVYVAQNSETAAVFWMNCRRQLSRLQFGAMIVEVEVGAGGETSFL